MPGIFNKINKYWDLLKNKVVNTILPTIANIGDLAGSDVVQGIASFATPVLNTIVPGLGSGLGLALPFISNLGKKARTIAKDWSANPDYLSDQIKEFAREKSQVKQVPKGIGLSRRPEQLHSRIQLKALPDPDNSKSYVEELDIVE
jgi:hypothetical protein